MSDCLGDHELTELVDLAFAEAEAEADDWDERRRALLVCLEKLSAPHRELLAARYVREQGAEAIGAQLGRTAVAVRMTLMRVRDALGRCIEKRVRVAREGQS